MAPDPSPVPPLGPLRPLTGFVGRAAEMDALAFLLASPDVRLLTIIGPGGIGKTRLAIETSLSLRHVFPDGIVLVPLAPVNDVDRVLPVIAQTIAPGNRTWNAIDLLDRAVTGKHMLIVLDNLEHLLAVGPALVDMLQRHPELKLLCTSRTRLSLSGEYLLALDPLGLDDARALFLQRASATQAGRTRVVDATTINEICIRLDRIPLAIELAAARSATLQPAALLALLTNPLSPLGNGPRDAPLRHRTMRDTIAWSYDLLDETRQVGFRKLAVFVGGFTVAGACAVLGAACDAMDTIEFLVARSLVLPMPTDSPVPRFTMLESIRQFGLERLAVCGEGEAARRSHADYLIRLAENATPFLDGPELQTYLSTLIDEMENFRTAIGWALDNQDGERANRLVGGVWRLWGAREARIAPVSTLDEVRREAIAFTSRALALSDDVPFAHVVEAMSGLGRLLDTSRETDQKLAVMRELLARSRAAGLPHGEYWAQFGLADIARVRGDWKAARAACLAAIALAPRIRNPDNQRCGAELHFARILRAEGDLQAAHEHLVIARDYGERAGNPHHLALVSMALATVCRLLGQHRQAAESAIAALDMLDTLHDEATKRDVLLELAELAHLAGLPHEAAHMVAHATVTSQFVEEFRIDEAQIRRYRTSLPEPEFSTAWMEGVRLSPGEIRSVADRIAAYVKQQPRVKPVIAGVRLSARECEVLRLVVKGHTYGAIGQELFISRRTVEQHVFRIMRKVDVTSRAGLIAWAVHNGVE